MNVRSLAVRVLNTPGFVDDALAPVRETLPDARDRALLTTLVYGATRHRLTLDALAKASSGRKTIDAVLLPILRVAIYQLVFLSKVPPHAAVNEAVEEARRAAPKAAPFVNAVLRGIQRLEGGPHMLPRPGLPDLGLKASLWGKDVAERLSVAYSHPEWLVRRWLGHGWPVEEVEAICAGDNIPPVVTVAGVAVSGDPRNVEGFMEGKVRVQDETAARVAPLLDPKPGETILDLCAAPGGKSAHLASLMNGLVVALDVSPDRIRLVRDSVKAFANVRIVCGDGRRPPLKPVFDAVLADVPCSNTAVLGRRADARWRLTPKDFEKLRPLQDALLDAAASLLKPGGRLVYSTCSLEPDENELRIEAFLKRHGEFTAGPPDRTTPASGRGGGFAQAIKRSGSAPPPASRRS
ncbi:MAG TPA: transcription antitermination factor NusB [Planctomycetota bacterium]|nr:transcription antitermination factor NusB [Planctomycetota bacterium]